jgi:hypothetical protein
MYDVIRLMAFAVSSTDAPYICVAADMRKSMPTVKVYINIGENATKK